MVSLLQADGPIGKRPLSVECEEASDKRLKG